MWLWTRQEAKQIDEQTIQSGVMAETLMEKAGRLSAEWIIRRFPGQKKAVVLCGPGHNGGDGYVIARILQQQQWSVQVVDVSGPESSDLRSLKKSQFPGKPLSAIEFLKNPLTTDIWIDALFGIGLTRPLDSVCRQLVEHINQSQGHKIAIDTPSGLDVNTGQIFGACLKAQSTLTVGHPKPGFYLNHGPEHCGKIHQLDIGFPKEISKPKARSVFLFHSRWARRWLPRRKAADNKTKGGRALILAGSDDMPGAAILAARAAKRVGAGYVYCSEREVLRYSPECLPWSDSDFSHLQSVLIGPGLGKSSRTERLLRELKKTSLPVVVDADAFTVAAEKKLFPFPENWLATPHAGELSRLLQIPSSEIEADRLQAARRGQEILGCPVLLKGFHSVVALPEFSVIVPTGNVALAKGGSGDVLGGMIAGFLSQGLSSERALLLSVYVHGWMADQWLAEGKDHLSLAPSDLIEMLPSAIHQIRRMTNS